MKRYVVLAAAFIVLLSGGTALAHGLAAAFVSIETADNHQADVLIKRPTLEGRSPRLGVRFADDCSNATEPTRIQRDASVAERWIVDCESPLTGMEIEVLGLDAMVGEAFIELRAPGIRDWHAMVRRDSPAVRLGQTSSEGPGAHADYFSLGVDHIITGFDHVLFVLGLFFIVIRTRAEAGRSAIARGVLATVTAFTVGHSVTLAAATLGLVRLPSAPTELLISLSVLLLAVELARDDRATWTMRFPWVVAFAFGLLHGFGFAGALAEIGLPPDGVVRPLLFFNLGVEAGQVAVVLAAAVIAVAIGRMGRTTDQTANRRAVFETVVIYGIGALAAYWCLERAGQWWV